MRALIAILNRRRSLIAAQDTARVVAQEARFDCGELAHGAAVLARVAYLYQAGADTRDFPALLTGWPQPLGPAPRPVDARDAVLLACAFLLAELERLPHPRGGADVG
jgi:hypothetical protein